MAAPDPADPLRRYIKVEQKANVEVVKILRSALHDIDKQLVSIAQREGVGAIVRQTQLSAARISILRRLGEAWGSLGDLIQVQAVEASVAASRANGQWDAALLRRMGLTPDQIKGFQAGLEQSARNAVQSAINRNFDATGIQNIPLSERVYQSAVYTSGLVDTKINSALARGLNWREFAGEVKGMINPNTPGGVSYAAKRLARTEINNSFHYSQIQTNKDKPWVKGMRWRLSGSHPKPDVCDPMANGDHADLGPGVYAKTDVPRKPHPQCLCTLIPEVLSEEEFVKRMTRGDFDDYGQKNVPGFQPLKPSAIQPAKPVSTPKPPKPAKPKPAKSASTPKPPKKAASTIQPPKKGFNYKKDVKETSLSGRHRDAIDQYWGGGDYGSEYINRGLRKGSLGAHNRQYQTVENLDDAIAKSTLLEPVSVYRGIAGDLTHSLKAGDVLSDKGFGSVSTDRSSVEPFRKGFLPGQKEGKMVVINLPKGHHAAKVPSGLDELLLARNSKYKVSRVTDTEVFMDPT